MRRWQDFHLWHLFLLSFAGWLTGASSCPDVPLKPCKCFDEGKSRVLCRGLIGLPRLTQLLREELAGHRIDIFQLESSDVGYMPSNLFYKVKVRYIEISSTNISHFTRAGRSAFYGLEDDLESLSMRSCNMGDRLQWHMLNDLRALRQLDLSLNRLERIPVFRMGALASLRLKGNRISKLTLGSMRFLTNLVELDLSENKIHVVRRDAFPFPSDRLAFLTLSDNQLRQLPRDFFQEMYGLRRIYLDGNLFRTLQEDTWSSVWDEFQLVDLLDNPLRCDCEFEWLSTRAPPDRLYGSCSDGPNKGKSLKDLQPQDFRCR